MLAGRQKHQWLQQHRNESTANKDVLVETQYERKRLGAVIYSIYGAAVLCPVQAGWGWRPDSKTIQCRVATGVS